MRLSYEGTRFSGSQKNIRRFSPHLWTEDYVRADRTTIQGALESFLVRLRPVREPCVEFCGRTDAGVHALRICATVDLQRVHEDRIKDWAGSPYCYYDPKIITAKINDFMAKANLNIRVLKTTAVPGDFKVRNGDTRRYLYRFAVRKRQPEDDGDGGTGVLERYFHNWDKTACSSDTNELLLRLGKSSTPHVHGNILPISESRFITELRDKRSDFDLDLLKETLDIFSSGPCHYNAIVVSKSHRRDSRLVKNEGTGSITREEVELGPEGFIRHIHKIEMRKVEPPYSPVIQPAFGMLDFYEVEFESKSFFRHQIRRIMSVAFSVARGKVPIQVVRDFVKNPDYKLPGPNFALAKPEGLSFVDVAYLPEQLEGETDDCRRLPVGPVPDKAFWRPEIDWSNMNAWFKFTQADFGTDKRKLISREVGEKLAKITQALQQEDNAKVGEGG